MTKSRQPHLFFSTFFGLTLVTLVTTTTAWGTIAGTAAKSCDWQPGQSYKMHWPQLPDLGATGMDVSFSKATLADDFKCTATGPITSIHLWASFAQDILPQGGAGDVSFTMSIAADVPADGRTASHPGQVLWTRTYTPGTYAFQEVNDGPSDWYEPIPGTYSMINHRKAYQYDFCISGTFFVQQEGTIYWLLVSMASNGNYNIGWRTTAPRYRWNDAAAFAQSQGAWATMNYPGHHPYVEQPVGLAFVIDGDDETAQRDFGDAPDSSNSVGGSKMSVYPGVGAGFPTAYQAGLPPYGPMHALPREAFYLGRWVSLENHADMGYDEDGVNNIGPMTDASNRDGGDDGLQQPVVLPPCQKTTLGYVVTVASTIMRQAYVNVWCDWNRDGDWDDTVQCPDGTRVPEWAVQNQQIDLPGIGMYSGTTPAFTCWHPSTAGSLDPLWMRITLSEIPWALTGSLAVGGAGPLVGYRYGETEDYLVQPLRESTSPQYDWGDAPDDAKTSGYPTLAVHNGAQHVTAGPWLGDTQDRPDAETDGQPDAAANGDNVSGSNDENGVNIPPLVAGETAAITVEVGGGGGVLQGWIDFDGDRTWSTAEKVYDAYLPDGVHVFWLTVPQNAVAGQSFARFRLSTRGGLDPGGLALDGEVEDYLVQIVRLPATRKWCQLPDTTPRGIDIRIDTSDQIQRAAADDFKCTSPDYLTHVTLWGSWKRDIRGQIKAMRLRLHADDPVGTPGADKTNLFSKPSPGVLWERQFTAGQFKESTYHLVYSPGEYWWDPATGELAAGGDSKIWQIDIDIDPSEAFLQSGSTANPVIYWLSVDVTTVDGQFGWKTRQWPDHFMDDAVWDMGSKLPRPWRELHYPQNHPYFDGWYNSADLAFCLRYGSSGGSVVTSQPGTATQCPAVETRCPATDTQCPATDTQCPATDTQCPATDTQCPVVATQCPTVETQCPLVATACYTLVTTCPAAETRCPATSTQCPAVSTQCPTVQTQCPATETECQSLTTTCPAVQTRCPASSTYCPPVDTQCPAVSTQCPMAATKCPVVETQCPAVATKCIRCAGAAAFALPVGWDMLEVCPVVESKCASVADYLTALKTARK